MPHTSCGRIPQRSWTCTIVATVGERCGSVAITVAIATNPTSGDSRAIPRPSGTPSTISKAVTISAGISSCAAHQRKHRRILPIRELIVFRAYRSVETVSETVSVAIAFWSAINFRGPKSRAKSFGPPACQTSVCIAAQTFRYSCVVFPSFE